MNAKQIKIPGNLYRDSVEYKRNYYKREGFNIPLWKAMVEVEKDKRRRGGFVL
jgi:hypothetical protein